MQGTVIVHGKTLVSHAIFLLKDYICCSWFQTTYFLVLEAWDADNSSKWFYAKKHFKNAVKYVAWPQGTFKVWRHR